MPSELAVRDPLPPRHREILGFRSAVLSVDTIDVQTRRFQSWHHATALNSVAAVDAAPVRDAAPRAARSVRPGSP